MGFIRRRLTLKKHKFLFLVTANRAWVLLRWHQVEVVRWARKDDLDAAPDPKKSWGQISSI